MLFSHIRVIASVRNTAIDKCIYHTIVKFGSVKQIVCSACSMAHVLTSFFVIFVSPLWNFTEKSVQNI